MPRQAYEVVSAAKAREWLQHNKDNRPLRRSRVDELKRMFERGEYRITHQGVAFGLDGRLQDGQHRLTALSEMPDSFSVVMSVTRGLDKSAFEVLDLGLKRTYSDALRIPRGLAECARYIAALVAGTGSMSPQFLQGYVDFIQPYYDLLLQDITANRRTWSSASVRAAAVIQMARGVPPIYVREVYRALVTADFNAMPPIAQSLFRAELNGRVKAQDKLDMFVRSLKIFNPAFSNTSRVQINDVSTEIADVRDFITGALPESRLPGV
ncbi:hypothetical protein WJ84_01625 [Burkholderia ubonensis]|nr:hypothetical protein WJ84_01625 [Burkholderia ubonensis]KVP39875.1 hypothetical protein WJ87_06740 [Burkholderia ubonensis]